MNIREFRNLTDNALREEGFEPFRLMPRKLWVWAQPAGEIVRFFHPHAFRRPWGFVYSGFIGIEIPPLRDWLNRHKPGEQAGIFHTDFVGYSIANEKILGNFMATHGDPVPAEEWAGLLKDRVLRLPESLEALKAVYRSNREELGWLAHPHQKLAWDFLLKWHPDADATLHVPIMLPNGRIV